MQRGEITDRAPRKETGNSGGGDRNLISFQYPFFLPFEDLKLTHRLRDTNCRSKPEPMVILPLRAVRPLVPRKATNIPPVSLPRTGNPSTALSQSSWPGEKKSRAHVVPSLAHLQRETGSALPDSTDTPPPTQEQTGHCTAQ